jgi:hypothetical protein
MKKWGAALGIVFIGTEIAGRVYLVVSGLYPFNGADAGDHRRYRYRRGLRRLHCFAVEQIQLRDPLALRGRAFEEAGLVLSALLISRIELAIKHTPTASSY